MADGLPRLDPINVGLAVGLAATLLCAGVVALGPGRRIVADAEAFAATQVQRVDAWRRQRRGFEEATPDERTGWARSWGALADRVLPVTDDSELTARVGEVFRRLDVTHLEVTRLEGSSAPERVLLSPVDGQRLALKGIPVEVVFRSSFRDAALALQRLEDGVLPARIESLWIEREFPRVSVRLRLTYFMRAEGAA